MFNRYAIPHVVFCRAALACAAAFFASCLHATGLPDTGQSYCYDGSTTAACSGANSADTSAYPRQDGRMGRDAAAGVGALAKVGAGAHGFDYTALDGSGNPTSPSSGNTPHPCVRDNVTGLVWEVKTAATNAWHDGDWAMTWYSSNGATNGGNAGVPSQTGCKNNIPGGCDTEMMVTAVNAAGWCGFHDWRLPSYRELLTLINAGTNHPAIETTYFPNTLTNYYWWSADTDPTRNDRAYSFDFGNGTANAAPKLVGNFVRLVRGPRL